MSPRIRNRQNRNRQNRNFDQFLSIKIETEPTDLPTQEADSTETLTGTLRVSTFPMRSERNRDSETIKLRCRSRPACAAGLSPGMSRFPTCRIEKDDFTDFNQPQTSWLKLFLTSILLSRSLERALKENLKRHFPLVPFNFESFSLQGFLFENKKNYFLLFYRDSSLRMTNRSPPCEIGAVVSV